jgi:3-phenylpropionate/trans-cinnamate dioxygenase ferredoxin component
VTAPAPRTSQTEFHDVASLSEVDDNGVLGVALPNGDRVCLVRRGEKIWAFADACTHQAMPLSAGDMAEGDTIECPWHGARFALATGAVVRGPAEDPVATYDVRVEGDRILVAARAR